MSDIVSYLFKTNAIRFCEENKPFFLTSGMISPYFSNTHFLYGSEKEAAELLKFIDESLSDYETLPKKVFEKVLNQYRTNEIYKHTIDVMKDYIESNIDVSEIDYISGGERRDWYFSNILAYLLNKPHITIYKDLSTYVSDSQFNKTEKINELKDKKVLHISDLITVASSYVRAWIPAIKKLGSKIYWSCVVVDRKQGGNEIIEAEGVKSLSLAKVDGDLFKKALELGVINEFQFNMLNDYLKEPKETMRQFLIDHPEFIEDALKSSNERTQKRVKLLVENDLYNLK